MPATLKIGTDYSAVELRRLSAGSKVNGTAMPQADSMGR